MGSTADDRAVERARSLVGKTIDGRYRIDQILAMGGMGTVYLALHLKLKKRVAIKALHPDVEDHPELIMRFEREALAGAQVTHQHVACATDLGDLDDGTRYLVMEYVRGKTLRAAIDRDAPFEQQRAVLIARQIAVALGEIHAKGIVHRDLKPRNVMLADGDFVKIVDFGLAKIDGQRFSALPADEAEEDARLTQRGVIFGTVEYLAPEAAFGMELVDARADLYALGVMLFEMLAGKHPFEGKTDAELFTKQRHAAAPSIASRNPSVSVDKTLEAVVQRLLQKDFDLRYQTAAEVVAALDAAEPAGSVAPPEPVPPSIDIDDAPIPTPISSARGAGKAPPSKPKASEPARAKEGAKAPEIVADDLEAPATPKPKKAHAPKAKPIVAIAEQPDFSSDDDEASRHAVVPPAESSDAKAGGNERWRTPTAVFVAGTVLALAFVYLAVKRDVADDVAPSASAPVASVKARPSAAPLPSPAPPPSSAPAVIVSAPPSASAPVPPAEESAKAVKDALSHDDLDTAAARALDLLRARPTAAKDDGAMLADVLTRSLTKEHARTAEVWRAVALSPNGPDLLYRFIELGGTRTAPKARELLKDPDVQKNVSRALSIALTLHEGQCDEKLAIVDAAVAEGDERALAGLEIVAHGCVKKPEALDGPIKKLRARLDAEKKPKNAPR